MNHSPTFTDPEAILVPLLKRNATNVPSEKRKRRRGAHFAVATQLHSNAGSREHVQVCWLEREWIPFFWQSFMRDVTTGLRDSLGEDSIIPHAPLDLDATQGTACHNVLTQVKDSLDF
jgi:hypothetical protein